MQQQQQSTHNNNRAPHLGCRTLPWHRKVDTRQRGQKTQTRPRNNVPHHRTPAAASVEQLQQRPAQCTPKVVRLSLTMQGFLAPVHATGVGSQRPAHPTSKPKRNLTHAAEHNSHIRYRSQFAHALQSTIRTRAAEHNSHIRCSSAHNAYTPDRCECRLPRNGTPTRQKLAHVHCHRRKGRKYYLHAITKSQLSYLQE